MPPTNQPPSLGAGAEGDITSLEDPPANGVVVMDTAVVIGGSSLILLAV